MLVLFLALLLGIVENAEESYSLKLLVVVYVLVNTPVLYHLTFAPTTFSLDFFTFPFSCRIIYFLFYVEMWPYFFLCALVSFELHEFSFWS